MDVEQYLHKANQYGHGKAGDEVAQKLNELKEVEFLSAVLGCCNSLLESIPAKIKNIPLQFYIEPGEKDSYFFYVDYVGPDKKVKKIFNDKDYALELIQHFMNFLKKDHIQRLAPVEVLSFSLNEEGIESLKEKMLGQQLYKSYRHAYLKLHMPPKEQAHPKPKL